MAWIIVSHTNKHSITKTERRQVEEHWYVFINTVGGLYFNIGFGVLPVLPHVASKVNPCSQPQSQICGLCTQYLCREGKPVREVGWVWGIFKWVGWTQACKRYFQKHLRVLQFCSQQSQFNWKTLVRAAVPELSIPPIFPEAQGSPLWYHHQSLAPPALPSPPSITYLSVLPLRIHLMYECWIYIWVTNTSFYALLKTRSIITKVNI